MTVTIEVRPATVFDAPAIEGFLRVHVNRSGRDGEVVYSSYSRAAPWEPEGFAGRLVTGMRRGLEELSWRRHFIALDGDRVVADGAVRGAAQTSGLHRARINVGVATDYRRQGLGRRLVETMVGWASTQGSLDWLDLDVFAHNVPAQRLYLSVGFSETGRTQDLCRVDGARIDGISMTMDLSSGRQLEGA